MSIKCSVGLWPGLGGWVVWIVYIYVFLSASSLTAAEQASDTHQLEVEFKFLLQVERL